MSNARILVIEDDEHLRALLRKHLQDAGCEVEEAEDGIAGSEKAVTSPYDLIILDLNLPKRDGLEVCRIVRQHDSLIPILMLTAKVEEIDRVLGFELGADDYLTKPFSIRELIVRIKAILRRVGVQKSRSTSQPVDGESVTLTFGSLQIDLHRRKVYRDGVPIPLSHMELELLLYLSEKPGKAFSREEILEEVWGYSTIDYAQNISTHINRLRKKLEPNPDAPIYVKTVRGFGYAFAELPELSHSPG